MAYREYKIGAFDAATRSFPVIASTRQPVKNYEWNPKTEQLEEFWEALESWDLSRYLGNNIVLESHNAWDIDASIGTAQDLKETDEGLECRVYLASLKANPRTDALEAKLKEGLVRGISVGFDYGERTDEQRDGKTVRVYRGNKLNEISLCLLPKDQDALVRSRALRSLVAGFPTEASDLDTEELRRRRFSDAGRTLSRARRRSDARDDEGEQVARFDYIGSLGKFERTSVGGIRVPARLTRTGILEYRLPNGKVRRELRTPEEVFRADSLKTLVGATVTDLEHHRGLLDPETWKDATLGHADNIRADGKFVVADLNINDADAVRQVENRELHDISCGYQCRLDFTPGIYEGQPYDAIQRDIRYNHVAVLPPGKGRAGTDVALRLDANDAVCVEANQQENDMTAGKTLIKLDGKDVEYGSKEHIDFLETAHKTDKAAWDKERGELVAKCDKAEGTATAAERKLRELEDAKKAEEEKEESERAKRSRARAKLITKAMRLLEDEEERAEGEEEEEEKLDARLDMLDAMSDRDIMVKVIKLDSSFKDADFANKSDDFIAGIFEQVSKSLKKKGGIDAVVHSHQRSQRLDAKDEPSKAEKDHLERQRNAWKKGPTGGLSKS